MLIDKFNVEWSSTCKTKDYLFVGSIQKYTKVNKIKKKEKIHNQS